MNEGLIAQFHQKRNAKNILLIKQLENEINQKKANITNFDQQIFALQKSVLQLEDEINQKKQAISIFEKQISVLQRNVFLLERDVFQLKKQIREAL